MGKILENLYLTLAIGLVLAIVIMLLPDAGYNPGPTGELATGVLQWLHVFFGITWIGLLYYFNFVQIPTMPSIPAELKPEVSKFIAPNALFYFRWGAAFTVLTGLLLAWSYNNGTPLGELDEALLLQPSARLIGIGMWLALIMAFNVWVDHLAQSEEGARARPRRGRGQGQGGADGDDHLADQHPAVDPDAAVHDQFPLSSSAAWAAFSGLTAGPAA